jgi:hypothetical protein
MWIATFFACFTASAFASGQATFIMRDGQRQSGTIASVSASGKNSIGYQFHLITDGGGHAEFQVSQFAAIDFARGTPSPAELQQLPAASGQNYIVLRNGTGQTGKLKNLLRGDTLLWINDAGQRQRYAIHDVARVYFDAPAARTATNLPASGGVQPPSSGGARNRHGPGEPELDEHRHSGAARTAADLHRQRRHQRRPGSQFRRRRVAHYAWRTAPGVERAGRSPHRPRRHYAHF